MTRMNSSLLRFRRATQRDCDTQSQDPLRAGSAEERQADYPKRKPEAKIIEEPGTSSGQRMTVITFVFDKDDLNSENRQATRKR